MKKYIVEFIGTFFLVLVVCMAKDTLAPLAIGATLMVMVYAGGHISGGHFNPAVTLGVWLRGKCETKDVVPYWIFQFAAAVVAVLVAGILLGGSVFGVGGTGSVNWAQAVLFDFLGTFALVWVVLNSATAKGTAGNSFYGLAIGFTVFACAAAFGAGAYNPAVALGLLLKGGSILGFVAMLIGDVLGAFVAATVFKMTNGKE